MTNRNTHSDVPISTHQKPEYDKIPKHIRDFAYSKAKMYLNIASR